MSAEPGNLTQKFQSDSTVPLLISEAVVPDSSGSQAKVQAETGTELPFSTKEVTEKPALQELCDQELVKDKSANQPGNEPDYSIPSGSAETSKTERVTGQTTPLTAFLSGEKEIEQVLFFFKDKTFRVYRPS